MDCCYWDFGVNASFVPLETVACSATLQRLNIDMPHLLNSSFRRRLKSSGAQALFISGIVEPYRDYGFKVVNSPLISAHKFLRLRGE